MWNCGGDIRFYALVFAVHIFTHAAQDVLESEDVITGLSINYFKNGLLSLWKDVKLLEEATNEVIPKGSAYKILVITMETLL